MDQPYFNGPLAQIARKALSRESHPDPWTAEIDAAIKDPAAVPLCVNCLFPQEPHRWFCPHCAFPTGDYVPLMPYLYIFPSAEILRRGVMGPPERRVGVQLFLIVFAFSQYSVFAPIYWFWMYRRSTGRPICQEQRKDIPDQPEAFPDS